MRIIAGSHRGRRIRAPEGLATRPMLDRVRESLFSTLHDWIEGARVLDLFAGSGSLGLEALSRGARSARMVERHRPTLELLKENVRELGLEEVVELVCADALSPRAWGAGERFDLVFCDPPYPLMEDGKSRAGVLVAFEALVAEHLADAGRVVVHVPRGLLHPSHFAPTTAAELRTWGTNDIWILGRKRGAQA
jgi:16S rRNA (guanine(966)-N(2))-methyltransferase RsmD